MSDTPINFPPIGADDSPVGGLAPPIYDPLIVEIDGDAARAAGWLGREIHVTRPVNSLPKATLVVSLARGFLVNYGGDPSSPDLRSVEDLGLLDGALITVRTARQDPETDYVLFEGYAAAVNRKADRTGFSMQLECSYVGEDVDFEPRRTFEGTLWRRWKNNSLPRVGRVAGSHCVFNPDGRPNMAVLPVGGDNITWTRLDGAGVTFHRPYFVKARQRDERRSWSWAAVFAYWWYWMLRTEDGGDPLARIDEQDIRDDTLTIGPYQTPRFVTMLPCIARAGSDTELDLISYIMGQGGGEKLIDIDPDTIEFPDESNAFNACLLGKPTSISIDGMSPLKALDWICARSGLGYAWETLRRNGQTIHGLRFFAPRSTAPRRFLMPSPEYRTDDKTWDNVRRVANVASLRLSQDYRPIVNRVRRVGGTIKYEITVELVPGWAQNDEWDVDPNDTAKVDAALLVMNSAAWDKYVKDVKANNEEANHPAGRLWGLNTFGAWSGYPRTKANHPFRADRTTYPSYPGGLRYPYGETVSGKRYHDFARQRWGELYDNGNGDPQDPANYRKAAHAFRPRRFEECITGYNVQTPFPPIVEVNYAAGAGDWRMVTDGVTLSNWDARVYFEFGDARGDERRDPTTGWSFGEAYIRGKLRVRITVGIRGDACLESPLLFPLGGNWTAGAPTEGVPHSRTSRNRGATVVRREAKLEVRDFVIMDREGGGAVEFSGGNSQWARTTPPRIQVREDARWAEIMATRTSLHGSDRIRQRGVVESPELVFPRTVGSEQFNYRPGDMVDRIHATDGANAGKHDIDLRSALDDDFAVISSIEWDFKLGGGSDGAPAYATRFVLETMEGKR